MSSDCSNQARIVRPSKKSARSTYICGHYDQELSKTQFYKHKKLFFDRKRQLWQSDPLSDPKDSIGEDLILDSAVMIMILTLVLTAEAHLHRYV